MSSDDSDDVPKARQPSRAERGEMVFRGLGGRRPRVLAHGGWGDKHLALDAGHLYWTDQSDGTVTRLPKDGGVPLILATDQPRPGGLVLHGGFLYWANSRYYHADKDQIVRMPMAGGEVQTLAIGQHLAHRLAVAGDEVYWTTLGEDGLAGSVLRGSTAGAPPVSLASGQKRPVSIVVDGDDVYWSNEGHKRPSYFMDGSVMHLARAGAAAPAVVAADESMPVSVVLDESHVYWTTAAAVHSTSYQDGTIMKRARAGGEAVPLVSWRQESGLLALDDTHVYWFGRWGGSAFRIRKSGGAPEPLLAADERSAEINSVAVDDRFVYWTVANSEGAGGAVWKMVK